MANRTAPAAQLMFDELTLDAATAPLVDQSVPAEAPVAVAPSVEGGMIRRVEVNPLVLARAAVLATAFATDHGRTADEHDRLAVFVRERDILLAADFDRGGDQVMRFRFSVPLLSGSGEGDAEWAGMTVRGADLLGALRNRLENSDRYGILSGDSPVRLEFHTSPDRSTPAEIRLTPGTTAAAVARVVRAQGGADLAQFEDVEPKRADSGLPELSAEALIETALATHPDVGVLLNPTGVEGRAVLVGVGRSGAMVTSFGPQEGTVDADGRALHGPVVLSPRLALASGHAQSAMAGALELSAKIRNNEHVAHALAAALAAALETDTTGEAQMALESVIGAKAGEAASKTLAASDSAIDGAVAAARVILAGIPDSEATIVAQVLRSRLGAPALAPHIAQVVRESAGDDAAIASVAESLVSTTVGAETRTTVMASARGHVELRQVVKGVLSTLVGSKADEQIKLSDLAFAAVRLKGAKSGLLADAVLPTVAAEQRGAWWETFAGYLSELGVPPVARQAMLEHRGSTEVPAQPTTAALVLPDALRKEWLRTAVTDAAGRFWTDAEQPGRVFTGIGDDTIGTLMMSDVALRPDPAQFPVTDEEIAAMLERGTPFQWKGTVYNSDLDVVLSRVTGLAPTDTSAEGRGVGTLFVARWTPAEVEATDSSTARVLGMFREPADRQPVPTDRIYIGDGAARRVMTKVRSAKEAVAPQAVVGTLRVFGFDVAGERLYMELPMKGVQQSPGTALAFAIDADRLNDFANFVTRKGPQQGAVTLLDASSGGVRMASPDGSRVVVIPTVVATGVPTQLQALVRAAGVAEAEPVSIAQAIARVQAMPRRAAGRVRAPLPAPGRFVAWRPQPQVEAPTPGVKGVASERRKLSPAEREYEEVEREVMRLINVERLDRSAVVDRLNQMERQAEADIAANDAVITIPRERDLRRDKSVAAAAAPIDLEQLFEATFFGAVESKVKAGTKTNRRTKFRYRRDAIKAIKAGYVQLLPNAPVADGLRSGMQDTALLGPGATGGTEEETIDGHIFEATSPTAPEVVTATPVPTPRTAPAPAVVAPAGVKARQQSRRGS